MKRVDEAGHRLRRSSDGAGAREREAALRGRPQRAHGRPRPRPRRRRRSTSAATSQVDDDYRTSVPNVYAAGDVIGFPALASTSMEQARVAVCHAFGFTYKRQVAPPLAVRHLHDPRGELRRPLRGGREGEGDDVVVGRAFYRDNARGKIIGDKDGRHQARLRARHAQAPRLPLHRRPRDRARAHRAGRDHARRHASRRSSRWCSTTRRCPRSSSTRRTTRWGGSARQPLVHPPHPLEQQRLRRLVDHAAPSA